MCRDELTHLKDQVLGYGFFGIVWMGVLRRNGQVRRVAVKTASNTESKEDIRQFLKEASIMQLVTCTCTICISSFVSVITDLALSM